MMLALMNEKYLIILGYISPRNSTRLFPFIICNMASRTVGYFGPSPRKCLISDK